MPAAVIVAEIVVSDIVAEAVTAELVGTALAGTIAGDALVGAVAGAAAGGTGAAISGGDIGQGIFQGALSGGVSSGVTDIAKNIMPNVGNFAQETLGVSPQTAKEIGKGVNKLATGTATGLIRGQDLGTALKGGAIGAAGTVAGDYLIGDPSSQSFSDKLINQAEKGLISAGISSAFGGGPSSPSSTPTAATGYSPSTVSTTGQSSGGAGSQALAQALNVGDPSSSLYSKTGGKSQNVWNQASLRNPNQDIGGTNG
jgi:hypothetical protein